MIPAPKVMLKPLHALEPGLAADCFALLVELKHLTTREGKPYVSCQFRDLRRTVAAVIWADSPTYPQATHLALGGFYKLRATFREHERYGPQLELQQLREVAEADRADGFREADFYERSRFESGAMFAELRGLVEAELKHEPLKTLVLLLLDTHTEKLMQLPATAAKFYPFPGGWLEHVLNVTRHVLWLADRYIAHDSERTPPLDRDLLLAGAVLHDIGRVAEYELSAVPGTPPAVTRAGQLFGHLLLGRDIVREAARQVPELHPQRLELLEHLVLTHLELPAWGSPRLPAIAEVVLLHHADDLDAKLELYGRVLRNDATEGEFTGTDHLLRKPLLKSRPPA